MILHKFDVINHPVRMRIFQTLYSGPYSINQLSRLLPDVPRPSLYRHIHKMLDAGVITVAGTRHVNGIEERFFTAIDGRIDPDIAKQTDGIQKLADHISIYGAIVAQDLARYLIEYGPPDLESIAARDHTFWATDEEFQHLRETIYQLLHQLEQNPPAAGRTLRRLFIMGHPLLAQQTEHPVDGAV